METPTLKKFVKRRTVFIILVVFLLVYLLKIFFIDSYLITSDSMENDLLVGDKVLISKVGVGGRMPTSIGLPFIEPDNKFIANLGLKSYAMLPWSLYRRMPGTTGINKNNVIAFNLPVEQYPSIDLKTVYIKRCIALPGDRIQVRNGILMVNNKSESELASFQRAYQVMTNARLTDQNTAFLGDDFAGMAQLVRAAPDSNIFYYSIKLNAENYVRLSKAPFVKKCIRSLASPVYKDYDIFPWAPDNNWNADNLGPFLLPVKDSTINLDSTNYREYYLLMKNYESIEDLKIKGRQLFLNNKLISRYRFKYNYYYMLGDNRNVSYDSRFWGPVPENHVLGKVMMIWYPSSKGPFWARLFKMVD